MRGGGSQGWQEQPQLLSSVYPPAPPANGHTGNGVTPTSSQSANGRASASQPANADNKAAIWQYYQHLLDRATPHTVARWLTFFALLTTYVLRIVIIQSHHIVTYAYAIYLLSLLIGFLTPKIDPAWLIDEDDDSGISSLPNKVQDEFRPFMRRLPEFRCWLNATRATLISLTCTLFRMFDVPVFWPILVIYFVTLFALTMKRQIAHMIRFRYVPFSLGKRRYAGRPQADPAGRVIHS